MRRLTWCVALLLIVLSACANPPEPPVKEAQAALDDARSTAQADTWAPAEYQAAKTSLDNARAEVDSQNQRFALMRNYDNARRMFEQAKADAAKAKQAAIANKEIARDEANQRLREATEAIESARDALSKAPATKDTKADSQLFTSDLDGLDQSLGEVRNMISSEDYKGASSKATAISQQGNDIASKLNEAAAKASARNGAKKAKPPSTVGGEEEPFRRTQVFYVTDRRNTGRAEPNEVYADERDDTGRLEYGSLEVSIPWSHQKGKVEAPRWWKLEFSENPEQHMVLLSVKPEERAAFYSALSSRVASTPKKEAFVFIHGYNVSFKEAARRTAQLSADLEIEAAPILYSWPSVAKTLAYSADEEQVTWSTPHLERFLEEVGSASGATTIHLIAHSMGNRALANALATIATKSMTTPRPRFRHIVLAAPDIDVGIFDQLARALVDAADNVTLYASSKDEALAASRKFHWGHKRVGETDEGIEVFPGIDIIDASAAKAGILGHSYFCENPTVIKDLLALVRDDLAPPNRTWLLSKQLPNGGYWWLQP